MTDLTAIERNYRNIGDTTIDAVLPLLKAKHSPMVNDAAATHAAAQGVSAQWWGQTGFENQWETTGDVIQPDDHNPAALRPWAEDPDGHLGDVIDSETRRRIGAMNVSPHAIGAIRDPDGSYMLRFASDADCAREYKRRLLDPAYKGGVYTKVKSLWEFLNIYCPPNDKPHPKTGVKNKDILPQYYATVVRLLTAFADAEQEDRMPNTDGLIDDLVDTLEDIVSDTTKTNPHRYGIGMGHRNVNGGGATGEYGWTPSCARALKAEIEARGGEAHLFQEHDGDSDPNFSVGKGLSAAARVGSDTVVNTYGPLTAIFFCHYNGGGGAGAHAIHPDGWVAPDRKQDNPLDVALARAIMRRIGETNTVGALKWNGWIDMMAGVMSERETGAVSGRWGYRLGELASTIQHRSTTPRLIIEAGSIDTSEKKYITNPAWVRNVYAVAICDALEDVFGVFPKRSQVDPQPESVYAKAIERPWADDAIARKLPYVRLEDKNHTAGYTNWIRVDRNYRVIERVDRQQVATDGSKFLNEPVEKDEVIWIEFAGENWKGDMYGLSPWGTMFRLDNLEPVDWPNQVDLYATDDAA